MDQRRSGGIGGAYMTLALADLLTALNDREFKCISGAIREARAAAGDAGCHRIHDDAVLREACQVVECERNIRAATASVLEESE